MQREREVERSRHEEALTADGEADPGGCSSPLGHLRAEAIWARRTPDRREEVGAPDGSVSLYLLCCGVRFRGGEVFERRTRFNPGRDLDLYGILDG